MTFNTSLGFLVLLHPLTYEDCCSNDCEAPRSTKHCHTTREGTLHLAYSRTDTCTDTTLEHAHPGVTVLSSLGEERQLSSSTTHWSIQSAKHRTKRSSDHQPSEDSYKCA